MNNYKTTDDKEYHFDILIPKSFFQGAIFQFLLSQPRQHRPPRTPYYKCKEQPIFLN